MMPNNRLQWEVLDFGEAAPEAGRYPKSVKLSLETFSMKVTSQLRPNFGHSRRWSCILCSDDYAANADSGKTFRL